MDTITTITLFFSAAGLILTGIGLIFAGKQIRASQRVAAGDFLLKFDEMLFEQHNEVHQLLRPGGAWSGNRGGPTSAEEWIKVERYMGMFERIKVLVDYKLLDIDTVNHFYGYRIRNIIANETIVKAKGIASPEEWQRFDMRQRKKHSWKLFIELWHMLEQHQRVA
jgi:hypothetical protein